MRVYGVLLMAMLGGIFGSSPALAGDGMTQDTSGDNSTAMMMQSLRNRMMQNNPMPKPKRPNDPAAAAQAAQQLYLYQQGLAPRPDWLPQDQ